MMLTPKTKNKQTSRLVVEPSINLYRCSKNIFVLVVLIYFLIISTHRFWLPMVAEFLVFQNQPSQADLIVVATPFRPRFQYALKLMQDGFAGQILLVGDARIKSIWNGKTS